MGIIRLVGVALAKPDVVAIVTMQAKVAVFWMQARVVDTGSPGLDTGLDTGSPG